MHLEMPQISLEPPKSVTPCIVCEVCRPSNCHICIQEQERAIRLQILVRAVSPSTMRMDEGGIVSNRTTPRRLD
jgi:hypothetical protein